MIMKIQFSHFARKAAVTLALTSLIHITTAASADKAASPSELLQKGIYSEETKGDLDAAMQLYQQVVKEAKESQTLAAQAKYHLGVCYYKKKDYTEASTAFEQLIADYPGQKDLVVLAQEYLSRAAALLPVPWTDGEELRLEVKFASGFKIGTAIYTADSGETNGQKIWRLGSHLFAGVQQLSRVEVEADSFRPLHCRWKHTLIGDADTVYSPGHAEVKLKGKDAVKKVDITAVVYDNEEAIQLFRRLPLATNYSTTLKVLSGLAGGAVVPFKLEVAAIEKVVVPAGTFDCYRAELSISQTFWYSADEHRYLVKFEAGGVVAELAEINHRSPGAPVTYKEPSLNLTLTAPADWMFFRREPEDAKSKTTVFFLDPDGAAMSTLMFNSLDNLKPEEKKSVRALAESELADAAKTQKDARIRPDSWKDRTVAGQAGVSVMVDFVEGKETKVGYAVFAFAGTNALEFLTHAPAKDLEAIRPAFEAIIDSFKTGE